MPGTLRCCVVTASTIDRRYCQALSLQSRWGCNCLNCLDAVLFCPSSSEASRQVNGTARAGKAAGRRDCTFIDLPLPTYSTVPYGGIVRERNWLYVYTNIYVRRAVRYTVIYTLRVRYTFRSPVTETGPVGNVHLILSSPQARRWWWWLQHPSKDDEACAISGKSTTNSKLNTSIIGGCRVGVGVIVDFFSNIRA